MKRPPPFRWEGFGNPPQRPPAPSRPDPRDSPSVGVGGAPAWIVALIVALGVAVIVMTIYMLATMPA